MNESLTKRPYAAFDIDGTLIRWQLFHALVDELAKQGKIDSAAYTAAKTARLDWKNRGHEEAFIAYEKMLLNAYAQSITKITPDELRKYADVVLGKYKEQTYRYTRALIADLKAQGYWLFAISRSNEELVEGLAKHYGFDDWIGTRSIIHDGVFTGEEENTHHSKDALLAQLITRHNASTHDSIAVGDSEGDIALLKSVSHAIAFNPSKKLFQEAKQHGWHVVVERKNMIYELEPTKTGYRLK